jgi:DegV family protein with EDD domain
LPSRSRRVRVITDSTADLPPELVAQWGIEVVPLYINFGEQSYRDGIDLSSQDFYGRLAAGEFPTTSQGAIGPLKRVYDHAVTGGGEAVSIHLSCGLSGTCRAAMLAADQVDGRVVVVDSRLLSMGIGWIVLAAAEAARQGHALDKVVALVEDMKQRTHVTALIENLEFLRRGGRIGPAQAMLGSLLDIRPIVGLKDGVLALYKKVRSRRLGLRELTEVVAEAGPLERVAVMHANSPDDAEYMAHALTPLFPRDEMLILPVSQVVATHVGPGAVGVCYVARKSP